MKTFFTKTLILLLTVILVVSPLLFAGPKKADAAFGAICTGALPSPETGSVVPEESLALNFSSCVGLIKSYILDTLMWQIINEMIRQLSKSVVNWINSGFQGNPSFVTDPRQALRNVAGKELSNLIEGSELNFLCSPFSLDIKRAIILNFQRNYGGFQDSVQCSLDTIVGNINDFTNSFKGGWQGWLALSGPNNNPLGLYLNIQDELNKRIASSQSDTIRQFNWGSGFLSWTEQKCYDTYDTNEDGDKIKYRECDEPQIKTPGSVIEQQLNNNLDSGRQRLVVADSFNEIVSAFIGQLVTQVLEKGLGNTSVGIPTEPLPTIPSIADVPGLIEEGNGGGEVKLPPEGPGGLAYPPTSGTAAASKVVFEQSGVFFAPAADEQHARKEFELPVPQGVYYKQATIDVDIHIGTLGGGAFNGVLVDLIRPKVRHYFAAWINKAKLKTSIDRADNTLFGAERPWSENTNYHITALYDAQNGKITFNVLNADTGEAMAPLAGTISNRNLQNTGTGLLVGFGLDGIPKDGAYYPPLGWTYSNLKVVLQ